MKKTLLLLAGVVLLFVGAYSLPEGGVPYKRKKFDIGIAEITTRQYEKIDMPAWLSWALVLGGAACVAAGGFAKK